MNYSVPADDASPGTGPDATVKVSVFHNVETVEIDGQSYHAGFAGYQPGHALVRVFEAEVPAASGSDPQHLAEFMFKIGNAPLEYLSGQELEMAERYRSRGLRSLSLPGTLSCCERSCCLGLGTVLHPATSTIKSATATI
jgi:hypothetical protein